MSIPDLEQANTQAAIQDAREYAENIVETVREPLVVLNSDLKVLTANHSFYETFKVTSEETIGNFIYDLGNRQWDIPGLRVLIEEILPQDTVFNGYEVEHDFVDIGRKIILLNARQIFRENIGSHIILLAMEDITERKRVEEVLRKYGAELEESKKLGDVLNEIDNVLYSSQDYDTIMRTMLQLATDVIGAESAVIFAREGERWKVRYEYKLPVSLIGQTFSNTEVMHTAITAITKRSLVSQDVANDPHINQKFVEMLGVRSLLDFPLIVRGEVVGDLTFHYHSSPVPFNERQVEFVRKLQIAISLALASERLLYTAQQSESKLKEAEILGKSGYFNYDLHTRKMTWSQGMFYLFGRDPVGGEPTVEDFFELHSIDPGLEAMCDLVGNKETSEFDAKVQRDDHSYVYHFVIRASKDANGNTVALFGTIQDVTERKRDEEALRVSEQQMYFATTAAGIGVWNWDLITNEVVWSERCQELFGYPSDHTSYQAVMQTLHAEERQRADEIVHKALKEKTDYFAELRIDLPDGQERWVMSKGRGFYDDQGNPISMHGIAMDITSRKYAEQEIERLNRELSVRAAELEAANEEMEAFNYTVAHDLRGPLNNTGLFFQTIKELCGEQMDEVCKEYLMKGFQSVQSMSQLIDVLLKFSKLSRVEPRRENVDLSAMVRELLDELKRTSPERTCVFHITDGIMVNADQKLLRVALSNLLRNAWKYTGKREEAVIEFGATEIGGKQVYFVRDNGSGFDLADADKLFRPFQRLPGSEEFRGTGIGLATVDRIIRRHGGKVWAEGEPGKGACFYFTLSEE